MNIEKFTEFPAYIEQQGISKDKKMLIFCTGGIRCEKGILELQDKGYDNVFQLEKYFTSDKRCSLNIPKKSITSKLCGSYGS